MTPQVEDGLELAQALGSLTDALSRAVLHAQQADSVFQAEPVELTLQVTVSQTGPGAGGTEWRVLGAGGAAVPHAGASHSLKMRFTPLPGRRDSAQDGLKRSAEQPDDGPGTHQLPQSPSSASKPSSDSAAAIIAPPGAMRPVVPRREATGDRPWRRRTTSDLAGRPAGVVAGIDRTYAVRVSCYLDAGPSGQPRCLVIERTVATVPEDDALANVRWMCKEAPLAPALREGLVDAVSEYVACRVDDAAFKPVKQQWEIQGMFNPAAASDQLERFQEWLQNLAQSPLQDAATQLGAAAPVAEVASGVAANIVVAPVDRAVQDVTKVIDIAGIVVGTALSMHPLALACLKHLAHTEFHEIVANAVTKAFNGLLVGSKDIPPAPASRPSSAAPSPGSPSPYPFPSWRDRPPPPTTRLGPSRRIPPVRPTPRQPPPGPPPSPPSPLAPPSQPKPKGPGAPGVGGPGGLG